MLLHLVNLSTREHFPESLYFRCYFVPLNVGLPSVLVGWLSIELSGTLCLMRWRCENVPGIE